MPKLLTSTTRIARRKPPLPAPVIESRICPIRGVRVMLDADLAELYQVETKALNRAVKRNPDRFPEDFMIRLTEEEADSLRCQNGTSNEGRGGRRYLPYGFTEHGVAMLSSVLNSKRAVQMNILIIRAFVKLRDALASHKDLAVKIERLERTQTDQANALTLVVKEVRDLGTKVTREFEALKNPIRRKPQVGFIVQEDRPVA